MQLIGEKVGNYKILEIIGKGGMGAVYKAVDVELKRIVALKMISQDFARDELFLKRFRMEAISLARLENQNIVSIHTLVKSEFGLFIVMEYVDGYDLAYLLQKGKITTTNSIPIFKQIADKMAAVG